MNLVTLFPDCNNVGLIKDVGQIPLQLAKSYGVETVLVTGDIDLNGDFVELARGFKIRKLKKLFSNGKLEVIAYILLNAKKIDWLNIYHISKTALYWGKLYKIINRKGKIYHKLDMDFRSCRDIETSVHKRKIFQKCIRQADIASAEAKSVISRIGKFTDKKLEYIPDGYLTYGLEKNKKTKSKENLFITVGRLGTKQKATEVLLEAYAKTAGMHNWKLILAGDIEERFRGYIRKYYSNNPHIKDRVFFTGYISSREKLYDLYDVAKVIVLPSRWESFGIVLVEALSRGCRIIGSSEVAPIRELLNEGKYGYTVAVDSIGELADAMRKITEDDYSESAIAEIKRYAEDNFSWDVICGKLFNLMKEETDR